MGNLIEAGQTGLVVVAVVTAPSTSSRVLSNATTTIVTDCVGADFEADFATAIENVTPGSPPSSPIMDDARRATPLL